MKKSLNILIDKIKWIIDYHFVYLLYNERKHDRYKNYMIKKWGDKFPHKF